MGVEVEGVIFHPFHGRVLATSLIPGAVVHEGRFCRDGGHDEEMKLVGLRKCQWTNSWNGYSAFGEYNESEGGVPMCTG
jgi:hypothetical protein